MRRFIWLAMLLAWSVMPSTASAQLTLDRFVLSSSGGRMNGGTLELDYTLAESVSGVIDGGTQSGSLGYWWSIMTSLVGVDAETPTELSFRSVAPTPFRSQTTVNFSLPQNTEAPIFIGVYDVRGALVKTLQNGPLPSGTHSLVWQGQNDNGRQVKAGVYFITFRTAQFSQTRRTVMLK